MVFFYIFPFSPNVDRIACPKSSFFPPLYSFLEMTNPEENLAPFPDMNDTINGFFLSLFCRDQMAAVLATAAAATVGGGGQPQHNQDGGDDGSPPPAKLLHLSTGPAAPPQSAAAAKSNGSSSAIAAVPSDPPAMGRRFPAGGSMAMSAAMERSVIPDQPDQDTIKMFVGQVPRSMDESELR